MQKFVNLDKSNRLFFKIIFILVFLITYKEQIINIFN
jgi:hypothetical protein